MPRTMPPREKSSSGYFVATGVAIGIATFFKTTNALFLAPLLIELFFTFRAKRIIRVWSHSYRFFVGWCALQLGVLALQGSLTE